MEVVEHSIDKCNVIYRPHPIFSGRDCQYFAVNEGDTVRELLAKAGIDAKQPIVISLDDRLLKVSEWDLIYPKVGQIINVKACVSDGGGGGGSNPIQAVAMIALVVAAVVLAAPTGGASLYLAGAMGISATTASAIVMAGIMMAGSMLINAVFAASPPSSSMGAISGQYSQASPTYSLSGGSNRMRPYESMPVIFGQIQFFPDLAARPFTEYQGEDQYLYQIFHFGLSNAEYSNFRIGTTALENYQEYSWSHPDSLGRINAFPGNVDTIAGSDLTHSAGWITRTTSLSTYRIGIDIEGTLYYANNAGGLDNTSVQLRVQYRPIGSGNWIEPSYVTTQGNGFVSGHYENYSVWVESGEEGNYTATTYDDLGNPYTYETYGWHDTSHYETRTRYVGGSGNIIIVSGASQAPRRATLFIDVSPGAYEVRVIRDTVDSTDARLQNKTNWSVLRSYQQDTSSYVGQNRKGLIIRASEQLNGAIQQLSCKATAKATYWDGVSWVTSQTSNPAHWFMHFAVGKRDANGKLIYGAGRSRTSLDLIGIHSWAQFCDAEGLTFNAVLDGTQTVQDFLNTIARCGFGSITLSTGKLGVVWDERNRPVSAAYGMSNIIAGSFEVTYITENLAEEIIVRYNNPDKDYIQDEVRAVVSGTENPTRSSSVDLYGCTNKAMAGKFANYLAAQQKYRTRRIKWDCDFEGFVSQRGDVVLLSHDLTQWGYSGRVVSVDDTSDVLTTTLTLDRSVPRNGSTEYLMLKRPNGLMVTYSVIASSAESNIVTIEGDITLQSGYELIDHMWFFSPLATPGKKVKILSVQPISESRVTVIATDEYTEFYDAWDGGYSIPPTNTLLTKSPVIITNLTLSVRGAIANGAHVNRVSASWGVGGGTQYALVKFYLDGNLIKEIPQSLVTGQDIDVSSSGSLLVEVTPVGTIGYGSKQTASITLPTVDLPSPPTSVSITTSVNGKSSTFEWPAVYGVQSYVVEVWSSGAVKRSANIGNALSWTYSYDDAVSDGGAFRSYQVRVYSVATSGQSATYASVDFNNSQIGSLANASVIALPMSFWFNYTKPTEPDFAGVMVWISTSPAFIPSDSTLVYDGSETWVTISALTDGSPLVTGTTYYLYAAGYDSFGKDSLTYTGKFTQSVLSPAWGLIQGDIDASLLDSGLNTRINKIDELDFSSTWEQGNNQALKDALTALKSQASLQASAQVTTEKTERVQNNEALAQSITTVQAHVDNVVSAVQVEQLARSSADSALAQSITTVQAHVDNAVSAVQVEQTATADAVDGINAKYTVKTDINGYVSGYGLISTANNGEPTSEFIVVADRFALAPVATNPAAVDGSPFFVLTAPTTISGVNIPAGTYIKSAWIHDASIDNAKIQDASIQSAKIASLDAAKITSGYIDADRIDAGSIDAKIANLDAAVISSGTIDSARIGDASIASAQIQDAAINTAKIGDLQVSTLKIGNNAVTVPASSYSASQLSISFDQNTYSTLTFATTGSPKIISFSCNTGFSIPPSSSYMIWCKIYRDGVEIANGITSVNSIMQVNTVDTVGAGTYTYTVRLQALLYYGYSTTTWAFANNFLLTILEVKK